MDTVKTRWLIEHVRGMFPLDIIRDIGQHLKDVYKEKNGFIQTEREKAFVAIGASSDLMRMDPRWYDVWRNPQTQLLNNIDPYTWIIFPPQVRYVHAISHLVPWHQDIGYQRLLGPRAHSRFITCFLPLDENPTCHSTLQFSREELPELTHTQINAHGAVLEKANFSQLEHYSLNLGDCLIFGDLALHHTFVPDNAAIERYSFEFRLVCPEDALDNKDYFDVKSGLFVRTDGSTRIQL